MRYVWMGVIVFLGLAGCGDAPPPTADVGTDVPPLPDYSSVEKRPCQHNDCPGISRCRWPGRDEERCQGCGAFGSACPERCIAWCQRPCSVDAHCPEGTTCTRAYGEVYTCDE